MDDELLPLLRQRPGWVEALDRLHDLYRAHGHKANVDADSYAGLYHGRRAAMVFDAVASRQRRYEQTVLRWVQDFQSEPAADSLSALAELGPPARFHLRSGEADTMRNVASGLMRFASDSGHTDDDIAVEAWAAAVRPLEVAPALDPYVGAVKGIGIALFCYLRMRAGADAIKPDSRVRTALERLGFAPPPSEAALLVVASVLASELGINRLVLDQLLWTASGSSADHTVPSKRGSAGRAADPRLHDPVRETRRGSA